MNITRSEQIKAGLQRSFQSGKSPKASIVCYGYKTSSKGKLQIYPTEAAHVMYIFERFAAGDSLGKISRALFQMDIPSPPGKEIWSKETISKILSNEKYAGDVILGKTLVENGVQVKTADASKRTTLRSHHPAIVPAELFERVQMEKKRRNRSGER